MCSDWQPIRNAVHKPDCLHLTALSANCSDHQYHRLLNEAWIERSLEEHYSNVKHGPAASALTALSTPLHYDCLLSPPATSDLNECKSLTPHYNAHSPDICIAGYRLDQR